MIIYIGFSTKTHKIFARIICRKFKHCAPVVITKNKCKLYQFTNRKNINIIEIKKRDIKILQQHGWIFIKYDTKIAPKHALKIRAATCVQFTKNFCGIQKWAIQTPYALLKYLIKNARTGIFYFIVFFITYIWNIPNTFDIVQ